MKKLDIALATEILGIGLVSIGVGMFSIPLAFIVVGGFLICVVTVWRDERDAVPVIASAAEQVPGRTPYTRNAERMVGFTSALGRALGYMGYGIDKSIASHDEIKHRQEFANVEDPFPTTPQQENDLAMRRIVEKEQNKRKAMASNGPVTAPQLKMLKIQATKANLADDEALRLFCNDALGKEIESVNALTKFEASKVIEELLKEVASKSMEREEPF